MDQNTKTMSVEAFTRYREWFASAERVLELVAAPAPATEVSSFEAFVRGFASVLVGGSSMDDLLGRVPPSSSAEVWTACRTFLAEALVRHYHGRTVPPTALIVFFHDVGFCPCQRPRLLGLARYAEDVLEAIVRIQSTEEAKREVCILARIVLEPGMVTRHCESVATACLHLSARAAASWCTVKKVCTLLHSVPCLLTTRAFYLGKYTFLDLTRVAVAAEVEAARVVWAVWAAYVTSGGEYESFYAQIALLPLLRAHRFPSASSPLLLALTRTAPVVCFSEEDRARFATRARGNPTGEWARVAATALGVDDVVDERGRAVSRAAPVGTWLRSRVNGT